MSRRPPAGGAPKRRPRSSLQLSFAVIPLVRFTADRIKMGEFVNPRWLTVLAWVVAAIIASLNAWLLVQTASAWVRP